MAQSAADIIREAEELLQTARFGLEDMRTRPQRAKAGIRNVVVFGRAVTFALQNLRSVRPDFEAWYSTKQSAMKADPLMTYFADLRTRIEKQASGVPVTTRTKIHSFSTNDVSRFYPKPVNAIALIFGDQFGGSGWRVKTDSGEEMYYVDLPPDIGRSDLMLHDAPSIPGREGASAADLAEAYLEGLAPLVREARERFAGA